MTEETKIIETMTEVELCIKYQSYTRALELLLDLAEEHPDYLPAKEALLNIYRKRGDIDKANEIAHEIVTVTRQKASQRLQQDPAAASQAEARELAERIDKIVKDIYESNDLKEVQTIAASKITAALDAERCVIITLAEDPGKASGYEYCRNGIPPSLDRRSGQLNAMLFKRAGGSLEPLVIEEPMKDSGLADCRPILKELNIQSILAHPMIYKSKLIGCVILHRCSGPVRWGDQDKKLFATIVGHAAVAINNARQLNVVQAQAITDNLTGLYNRRFFEDRFTVELRNARQQNYPICLALLDIDHFKRVNDTYGHAAGDKVLHKLGFLLRTHLRKGCIVARFGGEEFAVILPNALLHTAYSVMENIRKLVEGALSVEEGNPITISMGVFQADLNDSPGLDEVQKSMIEGADANLYRAKRMGRNRVNSGLEVGEADQS